MSVLWLFLAVVFLIAWKVASSLFPEYRIAGTYFLILFVAFLGVVVFASLTFLLVKVLYRRKA